MSEHDVRVRCPGCGRKRMVAAAELERYDIGCVCGGTMERTGYEEYDNEYARRMNREQRR